MAPMTKQETLPKGIRVAKFDFTKTFIAGPRSVVGNVSGYRCVSDCRSRGREFDPGPVPYFRGDHEIISTVIPLPFAD